MDFQGLLSEESSQGQPPTSEEIQEIPQDDGQTATPTQTVAQPTESERYWQSEHDKKAARLAQYERWDPYLQRLEQDPNFLQHSLGYFQGNGQKEEAEPELDEIPTADQVKAHNAWTRRQYEKSLADVKQSLEAMQQQAQVSQAMQRYATDYMRVNPSGTAQEAYEYAQWVMNPRNITPENLTTLFRAQKMGVNPTQAAVMQRVSDNANRRMPGVTVTGEAQRGQEPLSEEDQMKQGMLRVANKVLFSRQ